MDNVVNKMLLTSAGFENLKIGETFVELVNKRVEDIKVIFVPTAAIDEDARQVLPKCMADLTNIGVMDKNIKVYNLDEKWREDISAYDAIYFCGGSTEYLLERIYEVEFDKEINILLKNGGVYVGVSAGSLAALTVGKGLGYVNCRLYVHSKNGDKAGDYDMTHCPLIRLSNSQAIRVINGCCSIVE